MVAQTQKTFIMKTFWIVYSNYGLMTGIIINKNHITSRVSLLNHQVHSFATEEEAKQHTDNHWNQVQEVRFCAIMSSVIDGEED